MPVTQNNAAFMRLQKVKRVYFAHRFRRSSDGDEAQFSRGDENGVTVGRVKRMNLIEKERHFAEQCLARVLAQDAAQHEQVEQYLDGDGGAV